MSEEKKQDADITLALGYRPPYCFEEMLRFLAGRAIPGVKLVKKDKYLRTVYLVNAEGQHIYGWIKVGQRAKKNLLTQACHRL